jgi:hypothetical protein
MNILSLEPHYPAVKLSAVQMISWHLFLHRPKGEDDSQDPLFGPYITMLPREFDSHPLTWTIMRKASEGELHASLLDLLPPSIQGSLTQLQDRFWQDWKAVSSCLV